MAPKTQLPNIFNESALWTAMGGFGLLLGFLLLVFDGLVFSVVESLIEVAHTGPYVLSAKNSAEIREGIDTWVWAGFAVAVIALPLGNPKFRAWLTNALGPIVSRQHHDSLPPDRYGPAFFTAILGVLTFSVLAHWSLRTFLDTDWLEGDDGLSERWPVGTYLAAAGAAAAAAWTLRATKHTRLQYFYLALAVAFFLGGMEEISWGQRIFDWGTPAAIEGINFQDETTLHNVNFANNVIFEILFWGSFLGLVGGIWRLTANLRGLSDRMRLVLPSLTMAPALLLILVWRTGEIWRTANIPRLVMDHFNSGPRGSEVPEALLGLCLIIYTFTNLQKARYLRRMSGQPVDQESLSQEHSPELSKERP
ncbi:MAG: hypothetical protein H8E48_02480 [Chloroflexi bacterium]|nr:hypothetical protein [Chloroflexota bacterium]